MFRRVRQDATLLRRIVTFTHLPATAHTYTYLLKSKLENQLGAASNLPAEAALQRSWARIVGLYNTCDLQRESDKLPGITGLGRELASVSGQTFCAGVWLEDISRCLYWSAAKVSNGFRALEKQPLARAPSWSWAGWHGPVVMGQFVAETDTGRPWVSSGTFTAAKQGNFEQIELYAHYWPGVVVKKPTNGPHAASGWTNDAWWKFDPFRVPLDQHLQEFSRYELVIQTNFAGDDAICGWFVPDDATRIPEKVTCIVLYTESVRNSKTGRAAFGYYILVVQELDEARKHERLGIGVAVSCQDRISQRWYGREKPTTARVLV
ncbi:hypothetical protein EK21DRAFT_114489 [Setomelanomma holmii]|uniref:Uncharacterized protein n=1 Tax=Setomelanomma holmii TaxID=210430 RepID=A0A9P4H429_9PLEO|nr:hypothetical protein EK21DRAFT_114489 [Setomelanomma holmii]